MSVKPRTSGPKSFSSVQSFLKYYFFVKLFCFNQNKTMLTGFDKIEVNLFPDIMQMLDLVRYLTTT